MVRVETEDSRLCGNDEIKRFKQTTQIQSPENLLTDHIIGMKAGLYGLVIIARRAPPVPISNTTVKPLSADGTMP